MGVIKPLYNQKFLTCALCRSTRILRLATPVISQFHFPSQNMYQSTIADFYFLNVTACSFVAIYSDIIIHTVSTPTTQ